MTDLPTLAIRETHPHITWLLGSLHGIEYALNETTKFGGVALPPNVASIVMEVRQALISEAHKLAGKLEENRISVSLDIGAMTMEKS